MTFIERPTIGSYSNKLSESQARYHFVAQHLIAEFGRISNPVIGDFGCGNGESTNFLTTYFQQHNLNLRIIGTDISREAINQAHSRHLPNVSFSQADISKPDFVDRVGEIVPLDQFLGIAFIETLEHIGSEDGAHQALINIREILQLSHGTAVVSSPNRSAVGNDRFHPYNPYHFQEFNRNEFQELLSSSRLTIDRWFGQRLLPSWFVPLVKPLHFLATKFPSLKSFIVKTIHYSGALAQPEVAIKPLKSDRVEPKYFIAVCKA